MSLHATINIRDLDRIDIDLKRGIKPEYGDDAASVRVAHGEYLVWLDIWTHEAAYAHVSLIGSRAQFERMAAAITARLAEIDGLYAAEERQIAEALA